MRNALKVLIAVAVVITAGLVWSWPYIEMSFEGSAHYTEQDKREYKFYTPDILREMPRISPRYDFNYVNITGPAAFIHVVSFYDIADSSKVDLYLEGKGYTKQDDCFIDGTCWKGSDPEETITVAHHEKKNFIQVSVIYNLR
ncbi:hypothetical protein F3J29_12590 [Enterobacter sp. Cy-643]|uniref:hypothetical protein n=1 Tax=Enterobacter sp. Cy-643 TaxID=2608346 RepID=UPI00141F2F65|nr:hypothetical protein [Enterobacter sp. Cy-643]NIF32967.1 hypothetical protein [Enterobacter sp. Cy-643]